MARTLLHDDLRHEVRVRDPEAFLETFDQARREDLQRRRDAVRAELRALPDGHGDTANVASGLCPAVLFRFAGWWEFVCELRRFD